MYVCICNAVTDKQIREEARQGCCSLRELSKSTGCATTCGKCARHAREILTEEMVKTGRREMPASPSRQASVSDIDAA